MVYHTNTALTITVKQFTTLRAINNTVAAVATQAILVEVS